ncbi:MULTISPECIES: HD-GYP domain-containing protein [Pontibacillus]|uniref:HD-GYP domain-containing protein n=1 Tax=Pontibacillus chungwhensis TaxID=265426 RepID=A0ABY8UYE6_9BACI|nr:MULTISPECIES: HD-GYP domain-containing protein [Pontibacillus]MCD5325172.1 HD-GYP domain-containing protein [Pontibacillus sp. HN14]WIF97420.1 HD-GYP domain-containing protein [Pontibacillus chungwhensis]
MRLLSTFSLEAGHELAKPIHNDKGKVLIHSGVLLTNKMIERLNDYGVTYVYIEDEATNDIVTEFPISDQVRNQAIDRITDTFDKIKSSNIKDSFIFDRTGEKMKDVVRKILSDIQGHKKAVSLLSDVFTYDDYIFTHSLNVTIYTLALGTELGLPSKKLEELGFGAILHDVGKVKVPREVLLKPGKLNDEEFKLIKEHSEAGFNILRAAPSVSLVAAHCAYQHHERLDGSGYPRGLCDKDIHYYAKILAIADVFDAVTSNRVYRRAMLPHEGLEILYAGSGTKFDLHMIQAFRRSVAVYPNGLSVTLSDGRKGVVSRQNTEVSDRPHIRILEENGKAVVPYYEVDLGKELNLMITECDTTLVGKTK